MKLQILASYGEEHCWRALSLFFFDLKLFSDKQESKAAEHGHGDVKQHVEEGWMEAHTDYIYTQDIKSP